MLGKRFCGWLMKKAGWTISPPPPEVQRCVLLAAPHTSNWDYVFAILTMRALDVPMKVAIKDFWTRFPMGLLIKPLGGIGIQRSQQHLGSGTTGQVHMLAEVFNRYERIALIITPEGTRSTRNKWKTGFYHVAQTAKVPIVLAYADYKNKTCGFGPVLDSSTDKEQVMRAMMKFYADKTARYPENFSLDNRFI